MGEPEKADEQEEESKAKKRAKGTASGLWSRLKSNRAGQALLATVAGAVVAGLAVAGIAVPLHGRGTLATFTLSPGRHLVSFYSNQNPGNCENGGHFIVDANGKDLAWATNGDEGPTAATFGLTGIVDAVTGGTFRLQAATSLASCTVANLWVRTQALG